MSQSHDEAMSHDEAWLIRDLAPGDADACDAIVLSLPYHFGLEQGRAVRDLLEAAGFADVASEHDLEGRDRVSLGRMPE